MKKFFFFSLAIYCASIFAQPAKNNGSTIILSEIMFAAPSGDNEFIELYNTSNTENVDLRNFQLRYYKSSADIISDAGEGTILKPQSFAVIFEGDYDFSGGIYKDLIPDKALVLKISDKAFGSSGMSNSSDRTIRLLNPSGEKIEEYTYTSNNSKGISDEKISLNDNTSETNWKNSMAHNGTPGFRNSVTPINFDPGISKFFTDKTFGITGNKIRLLTIIKNFGTKNTGSFQFNIYRDKNDDSTGQPGESLIKYSIASMAAGDSISYQFSTLDFAEGENLFIAKLQSTSDENLLNNKFFLNITGVKVNEVRNDLVINEIMYAPDSPSPEWVEIFNKSEKEINLSGYNIADNSDTLRVLNNLQILKPKEYFVFSTDSSITDLYNIPSGFSAAGLPTLNNSGDKIILMDSLYRVIDSLEYSPAWGGSEGKSLERIYPDSNSTAAENWSSSNDFLRATPGKINSVTKKDFDIECVKILFTPENPVIGENVGLSAKIKNTGKNAVDFSLNLFEDTDGDSIKNDLLDNLANQFIQEGDSAIINFNYKIEGIQKSHAFIAEIASEADQDTSNNKIYKSITPGHKQNSVLINEIMYDPAQGESEWVELFNNTGKNIDISNWGIVNLLPSPTFTSLGKYASEFSPGEFIVVASDSSFLLSHQEIKSKIIIADFGSLNNSEDGLELVDNKKTEIDSLVYNSEWGGGKGFSLERIKYSGKSNDSANWRTSLNKSKSTPALENSVLQIKTYNKNSIVINEIMFDPSTDNSEFIEFFNTTDSTIDSGGWTISNEQNKTYFISKFTRNFKPGSYFVFASDSSFLNNYQLDDSSLNIAGVSSFGMTNNSGLIILKDATGNTIDSIRYFESWHNPNFTITKNVSLEKINPYLNGNDGDNWSSSTNTSGASPGTENSIFTTAAEKAAAGLSVSPNPFSPDNDGYEDFTIIRFNLPQKTAQVKAEIFDSRGRLVRTLRNNAASGNHGSIIFDGLDDNYNPLRMGIYIVLIEALNADTGVSEKLKTVVVVARKL